jgi:hypothetical protein
MVISSSVAPLNGSWLASIGGSTALRVNLRHSPAPRSCIACRAAGASFAGYKPKRVQPRNEGLTMNLTVSIAPVIALIAGILILIMPRLLNYIVAIYLILIGIIGLFGTRLHL